MTAELTATPGPSSLAEGEGVFQPSQPGGVGGFLSDVIVDLGFVERELVESAVNEGRQAGKAAVAVLLERGELTTGEHARAIAERNGLPFVDLERYAVDKTARQLIDRGAALRYRAVPIGFAPDGSLVTALADPLDTLAVSDIAVMTKSDLVPVVADAAQIEALVETLPKYRPGNDFLFAGEPSPAEGPGPPATGAAAASGSPLALVQPPTASPAPAGPATPTAGLESRIVELVQSALNGAAASEVERLEQEVARLRAELELARREIERLSPQPPTDVP